MKEHKGIGCGGILIIVIILMFVLFGGSGNDSGGGRCIGCGSKTSYRYTPGQGWWCYFCTH